MNSAEMRRFLAVEKKFIELAKWYEGERRRSDPGDNYVMEWVSTSASTFRERWNKSCCKNCAFAEDCGHFLKTSCDKQKKLTTVKSKPVGTKEDTYNEQIITQYIDCSCKDFDHVIRILWVDHDPDGKGFPEVSIEFRVGKFPSYVNKTYILPQNKWKRLWIRLIKLKDSVMNYLTGIKWAMFGRPQWYTAYASLGPDEVIQMTKFLSENITRQFGRI